MNIYKGHRFPPDIISYAVWIYFRFNLSLSDTFFIDEVFAGVPDHSNQWQAALSVEGRRPGWWAEQSHEAGRVRERGMRKFTSVKQAQRFLGTHVAVSNLFNLGRHLIQANHYRNLRISALTEWARAVA